MWYRKRPMRPFASAGVNPGSPAASGRSPAGFKLFCRQMRAGGRGQPGTSCHRAISSFLERQAELAARAADAPDAANAAAAEAAVGAASKAGASAQHGACAHGSSEAPPVNCAKGNAGAPGGMESGGNTSTPRVWAQRLRTSDRREVDPRERPDVLWAGMDRAEQAYYVQQAHVLRMEYEVRGCVGAWAHAESDNER